MEYKIKDLLLLSVFSAACATTLCAQQAGQGPYQGKSEPPPDDQIITTQNPEPKPPAGQPYDVQPAAPVQAPPVYVAPQAPAYNEPHADRDSNPSASAGNFPRTAGEGGTDGGIVRVAPPELSQPGMNRQAYRTAPDPDGDIVHPLPLRPGELGEGTMIRVRLLTRLSSRQSEKGEPFSSRVASDVIQDGRVVIPSGAEITGRVAQVSAGHTGGFGSMRLQPDELIMPDGSRYRLHAQVTATPGSGAHVVGEGTIRPDSRLKKDSLEYGGAVGVGVVAGAVLGGPAGAAAGGLIGAGAITVHLLVNHPQATLESGTVLRLMLTDSLDLVPAVPAGN